jgi:hypothetical protein
VADRPDSISVFRSLRARLRRSDFDVIRCHPQVGGRLAPLAGQRLRRVERPALPSPRKQG